MAWSCVRVCPPTCITHARSFPITAHADEVDALIAAEMQAMGAGARRSIDDRFPPADRLLLAGAVKVVDERVARLSINV